MEIIPYFNIKLISIMIGLGVFSGAKDWIFGIDWLDDYTFITGSRDRTISVYKIT